MRPTHQDIAARIASINDEATALNARHAKELESLQELCGGIGHTFGKPSFTISMNWIDRETKRGQQHHCTVCDFTEWVGEVTTEPHTDGGGVKVLIEQTKCEVENGITSRFGLRGLGGLVV